MDICFFTGRLTRDPAISQSGDTKIAKFSFAVDTGYGENKKANFFNMVAFGHSAEGIDKYARQGTKLLIQSEAQNNNWTDKDGNKHYDIQFVVRSWEFAESKKEASQGGNAPAPQTATASPDGFVGVPSDDDDLEIDVPFV